jgi:hypothetical protein
VRFVDFLKTTVLVCAAAASVLAAVAVAGAAADENTGLLAFCALWWLAAGAAGAWMGRRAQALPPIADLLAGARATTTLPEHRPGAVLLNRLWPLLVALVGAGAVAFLVPQVPAVAAGFAVIWALYWRRQDRAVTAIEERDGVAFYVERTSPLRPMQLVRTPGFRRATA